MMLCHCVLWTGLCRMNFSADVLLTEGHVLSSRLSMPLQAQRTDHSVVCVLQGEAFDFGTPVVIDGAVEVWMSAVEKEMRSTLHRSGMLMLLTE
jgi:hypothetical protein